MKRIVILTATRAEYGLLQPIIKKLQQETDYEMLLAVTGMHLSPEFGLTVQEIECDGIPINKRIEIVLSSDTPVSISKSMGLAMISFSEYFDECKPDALMVLGDRYETLAVCCAAMNARIPIFHLNGGDVTEGMVDEAVRHCITKMSYLHFASTEAYRTRIIQMGESPDRTFHVGAMGVENALHIMPISLSELEAGIGYELGNHYAVGTFHPVTLENSTAETQIREILSAIDCHKDIRFLFTKANSDANGRIINQILSDYAAKNSNLYLVDSLGRKRYMSALRYAEFVIGNSSSGLMEAPSFGIPTIDIGDRQKGRIAGESVIHCRPDRASVNEAIDLALSENFKKIASNAKNPYGDGNTSVKILEIIKDFMEHNKINLKKKFYDIAFSLTESIGAQ